MTPKAARAVFEALFAQHGPQHWWPAGTPFEVMVGAVLTQNTSWRNVECAIINLKAADALEAEAIVALPQAELADLLVPVGYFNVKAQRLKAFCTGYLARGGYARLKFWPTLKLRRELLAISGIGPETADDILLYAFARPVFVIDAYTRRLFSRLGLMPLDAPYEVIRAVCERALGLNAPLFNEYHALIVTHGKHICRTRPRCEGCVLRAQCPAPASGLERRPAHQRRLKRDVVAVDPTAVGADEEKIR